MIYPFTIKSINHRDGGMFEITIERQKTLEYRRDNPNGGYYENPVVIKFQEFYSIEAETEEQALGVVASRVAEQAAVPSFNFDLTRSEINVISS